jgi:hypothetical protein
MEMFASKTFSVIWHIEKFVPLFPYPKIVGTGEQSMALDEENVNF